MLIVSHDRFFLDSLATKILSIENGVSVLYEGNYSQFMWAKESRLTSEISLGSTSPKTEASKEELSDPKQQARELAKLQKQLSNKIQRIQKAIEAKEGEIAEIETGISRLESSLASPPAEWTPAKLVELTQQHSALNAKLDEAMEAWECLNLESEQALNELKAIREGK